MNTPMPKDNEVDEKVTPVAWANPADINCIGFEDSNSYPGIRRHADELHSFPLYSAATVADLRAEVERLNARIGANAELHSRNLLDMARERNAESDRADAAERRVGELEADARRYRYLREKRDVLLCTGFFGNCCVNKTVADVDAAIDTLTGADPT